MLTGISEFYGGERRSICLFRDVVELARELKIVS